MIRGPLLLAESLPPDWAQCAPPFLLGVGGVSPGGWGAVALTVLATALVTSGIWLAWWRLRAVRPSAKKSTEALLRIQRDLATALNATTNVPEALDRILDAVLSVEAVDCGVVYLYNEETGGFDLRAERYLPSSVAARTRRVGPDEPETHIALAGEVIHLTYDDLVREKSNLIDDGLRAGAIMPVRWAGRVIASLNVGCFTADAIPGAARAALEAISARIGELLAHARARQSLAENEERFRKLAETAMIGITIIQEMKFAYVNPELAAVLGYRVDELIGKSLDEIVHPSMREITRQRAVDRLNGGYVPQRYELLVRRKDGVERWLEVSAARAEYAGSPAIVGTAMDITSRKEAEAALLASEQRYRLLATNATDMISRLDSEAVWQYVSPAIERILGYVPDEVIGRNAYDFFHPEEVPELQRRHEKLLIRGGIVSIEMRMLRRDGSWCWLEVQARAIRNAEDDAPVEIVSIARDISERKQSEEERRHHEEQLAHVARVSTMGEMASAIAHQLAQPLSAILYLTRGCLTRIRAAQIGLADVDSVLDKVATQADRAAQAIHHIKTFVRKSPQHRTTRDLNAVVQNALAIASFEATERGVLIATEFGDDVPPVEVDAIQIEQVLLNLLRNGMEAMNGGRAAGGGRITVATGRDAAGDAAVTVTDAGPGLSAEIESHAFDSFYTTKAEGMGMGLSISRTIIEAHGGLIWGRNAPGRGAVFGFSLPAAGEVSDA